MSPPDNVPLSVAVMVCDAVLVMKSELLEPLSAEKERPLNLTVGAILSTVALVVSAVVVVLPALSVAIIEIFLFVTSIEPGVIVLVVVQVPDEFVAATADPPPNWLKSTVTLERVSVLLSPAAVLFQVAVTVSPILKSPPVPLAPLMLILASVTVGATSSTVALVVSAVVVVPVKLVALTETLRLLASMLPDVRV